MRMLAHRLLALTVLVIATAPSARAQWTPLNPVVEAQAQPDGVLLTLKTGYLRLRVCSDSIVRVVYSLDSTLPQRPELVVTKASWPRAEFSVETQYPQAVVLKASRLT